MLTVAKFGGSSLASGAGFLRVRALLLADPARRAAVVSAPGRRFPGDEKLTDLLYRCHGLRESGGAWRGVFSLVRARLEEIVRECLPDFPLRAELDALEAEIAAGMPGDALVSRGERFSAELLSALLGWELIDGTEWLRFTPEGEADGVRSFGLLQARVSGPFVTPGFYGASPDGAVHVFPRGGSDITGALAAAALSADLYENWTDVPGLLQADPAFVPETAPVRQISYAALRELSLVGTQVLHEGAVRPVWERSIPTRIRSTFLPDDPGTLITPAPGRGEAARCLTCRREQALVSVTGAPCGALETLLREAGVRPAVLTASWERQTAALPEEALHGLSDALYALPGMLCVRTGLALPAVLTDGGDAALLLALERARIPVSALLRPFGGSLLLLAVPDAQAPAALRALHTALTAPPGEEPRNK